MVTYSWDSIPGYSLTNYTEHISKRGGVTRMVAGPSAGTYMELMAAFSPKGATMNEGAHKTGEVNNIPLYKVPSDVIPSDEVLCVF